MQRRRRQHGRILRRATARRKSNFVGSKTQALRRLNDDGEEAGGDTLTLDFDSYPAGATLARVDDSGAAACGGDDGRALFAMARI